MFRGTGYRIHDNVTIKNVHAFFIYTLMETLFILMERSENECNLIFRHDGIHVNGRFDTVPFSL